MRFTALQLTADSRGELFNRGGGWVLPPSQLSELPASHKNSSNNKGVDNNPKDRTTTTVPGGTFTPWNEAGGKRWKTPAGRGTAGVGGGACTCFRGSRQARGYHVTRLGAAMRRELHGKGQLADCLSTRSRTLASSVLFLWLGPSSLYC